MKATNERRSSVVISQQPRTFKRFRSVSYPGGCGSSFHHNVKFHGTRFTMSVDHAHLQLKYSRRSSRHIPGYSQYMRSQSKLQTFSFCVWLTLCCGLCIPCCHSCRDCCSQSEESVAGHRKSTPSSRVVNRIDETTPLVISQRNTMQCNVAALKQPKESAQNAVAFGSRSDIPYPMYQSV